MPSQSSDQGFHSAQSDQEQDYHSAAEDSPQEKKSTRPKKPLFSRKKPQSKAQTRRTNIDKVWEKMGFDHHFPDFPRSLFTHLMHSQYRKVPLTNFHEITGDRLEFLGDRILKLIHGRFAFEMTQTSGDATKLVSILESNRIFSCYLEHMGNVCSLLGIKKDSKTCANTLEIIVGALFYYYFYKHADYNVIQRIDRWMRDVTIFSDHVMTLIRNKMAADPLCPHI